MSIPRQPKLDANIHVFKYIKNYTVQGLLFTTYQSSSTLEAYCNADWAACPNTCKFVNGIVVLLSGSLIS